MQTATRWLAGLWVGTFGLATAAPEVELRFGERIPLRDGVELAATVYQARDAADRKDAPCVFTLTPYIAQSYHERGLYFAAQGYVFLTVDARGRGNSGGEFTPLLQETTDAHDVTEWLARQPWCHGKVSLWGGSYAGYNQWTAAMNRPQGLGSIVPVASPYPGVDFPASGHVYYSYDVQWLLLTAGKAAQDAIFGDGAYWQSVFLRRYREHRPFRELDTLAGLPSQHFQTWLDHPHADAYWARFVPTAEQYAALDLPILSITGMYDGDQLGALAFYRQHHVHGTAAALQKHYLVIGPWDHAGTRKPQAEVAGVKFGPGAVVDINAWHKAWYDWTLKSGTKPTFLQDRVLWYVSGQDVWRAAPTLEAVTGRHQPLYLDAGTTGAHSVYAAGYLQPQTAQRSARDHWIYDPLDLSAFDAQAAQEPMTSQRELLRDRRDRLIYHSAPYAEATEIAGFFELELYLSMDQPDTDIAAHVYEITADGSSIPLAQQVLRARYRDNPAQPSAVPAGKVLRYHFKDFNFAARRLAAGSRLRLVVGAQNSPYWQKNYNSGGDVSAETAEDARTVTVTLHHARRHPSQLRVPIAAAGAPITAAGTPL